MEIHLKSNGSKDVVIPAGYYNRKARRLIAQGKGWKVPGYLARVAREKAKHQAEIDAVIKPLEEKK